ncbi:fibulin-7-like [Pelobates fuscus]|uniref:fibulin-7-like n=1 Tax=Pelobates fuscus TaxID=191477 RepID=UPI002FE4F484
MLKQFLLVSIFLQLLVNCKGQACSEHRETIRTLRQVQKLLTDHESSYLKELKSLTRKLTRLGADLVKADSREQNCPPLKAPRHGRKLGAGMKLGHEMHFVCDPGYLLLGSETRICLENQTWSGQSAVCTAVTNTSSPFQRPAKCSSYYGTQHCTCDPGFLIQPGALCQDLDECTVFQSKPGSKICVYECVNTAGSYRCVCPRGYVLDTAQNRCQDIDECVSDQSACPGSDLCVNLFGGFICAHPECPKSKPNVTYVRTSGHQCERTPCPVGNSNCLEAPHSISFHYLAVQSQLSVPRVLFTMTAPHSLGGSQRFSIVKEKGQRFLQVRQAGRHRGELVLNRSITGPSELQVEVEMSEMSAQGILGKHIFTVTVYVSQYPF